MRLAHVHVHAIQFSANKMPSEMIILVKEAASEEKFLHTKSCLLYRSKHYSITLVIHHPLTLSGRDSRYRWKYPPALRCSVVRQYSIRMKGEDWGVEGGRGEGGG